MARARVYGKDQQCPRCGSNWLPKYGRSRGKQTYRCRPIVVVNVSITSPLSAEHPHRPEGVRELAVDLYTEGSSLEAALGECWG